MAQNRPQGGAPKKKLARDRITEALVPDPSQPAPDAVVLHGYVGNSPDPNNLRLYLDHELKSHVEIPEAEVLHSEQLPDDQGTLVWVTKTLSLPLHSTHSSDVQAQFLTGGIAAAHMPSSGPADMAVQLPHIQPTPAVSIVFHCQTRFRPCWTPPETIFHCQTRFIPCMTPPETIIQCHTVHPPCFHPTPLGTCPITLPFCRTEACPPSDFVACPPTLPHICFHSQVAMCPSATIPCQTPICPSRFGCPSGPACFGAGGNPAAGG